MVTHIIAVPLAFCESDEPGAQQDISKAIQAGREALTLKPYESPVGRCCESSEAGVAYIASVWLEVSFCQVRTMLNHFRLLA